MISRRHSRTGSFWASRGAALTGIVALHVAAVAVALTMKGPRADANVEATPIEVVMITEPQQPRTPEPPVRMEPVVQPQMVIPVISIEPPPAPAAITVVEAPPPAPPPAVVAKADPDAPVTVSEIDYVRMPKLVYPAAAARARVEGVVQVRVLVGLDGKPNEVHVHRSSGFDSLDRAACEWVLGGVFRPYVSNGQARRVSAIVPVQFSLKRGKGRRGGPDRDRESSELDVGGQNHHAMRGHPEELRGLSTAALHPGE